MLLTQLVLEAGAFASGSKGCAVLFPSVVAAELDIDDEEDDD